MLKVVHHIAPYGRGGREGVSFESSSRPSPPPPSMWISRALKVHGKLDTTCGGWAGAKLSSLSFSTETAVAGYQTFRRRCFVHFGGSFQVLSCVPPPVDGKSREVSKVELFWLNKRPFYAKVLGKERGLIYPVFGDDEMEKLFFFILDHPSKGSGPGCCIQRGSILLAGLPTIQWRESKGYLKRLTLLNSYCCEKWILLRCWKRI